jgi:alkylation response protein AidB-like acyl-CoA dehydrogenase
VAAEVARAEAAERAARAFLHGAVDGAADGSLSTDEAGRRLRLAATHATWAAAGAVDRMYRAAGGSAVHEDAPIQRVFRDVHVATQHAMVSDRTFELLGQGSPPGPGGGR